MSGTIATSDVYFTAGDDTGTISGTIGTNASSFTATALPLVAGVNVIVTEAVNITNGGSSHSVTLALSTENFGSECTQIKVILVEDDGTTEHDAVIIDTNGDNTTSSTTQTIPAGEEWIVKLEIELDADATAVARSITLTLSYT